MSTPIYFEVIVSGSDRAELRRLRVPVGADTTVRQFAQDCLARFVKQTRFQRAIEVAVEDVSVGGCSLFYNDPVTAVVRPNEMLTVRLQNVGATDVTLRRLAVQSGEAIASQVSPAEQSAAPSASDSVTRAPTLAAVTAAVCEPEARVSVAGRATKPQEKRPRSSAPTPATEPGRRPQPVARQPTVDPMVKAVREGELGWGKDAHKNFAANYVADPDKLARLIRKQSALAKAAEAAAEKAARAAGAGPAPADDCDDLTIVGESRGKIPRGAAAQAQSAAPTSATAPITAPATVLGPVATAGLPTTAQVARKLTYF